MGINGAFVLAVRTLFQGKAALMDENLALRQQLEGLGRSVKRPKLRRRERIGWAYRPIRPGSGPSSARATGS